MREEKRGAKRRPLAQAFAEKKETDRAEHRRAHRRNRDKARKEGNAPDPQGAVPAGGPAVSLAGVPPVALSLEPQALVPPGTPTAAAELAAAPAASRAQGFEEMREEPQVPALEPDPAAAPAALNAQGPGAGPDAGGAGDDDPAASSAQAPQGWGEDVAKLVLQAPFYAVRKYTGFPGFQLTDEQAAELSPSAVLVLNKYFPQGLSKLPPEWVLGLGLASIGMTQLAAYRLWLEAKRSGGVEGEPRVYTPG